MFFTDLSYLIYPNITFRFVPREWPDGQTDRVRTERREADSRCYKLFIRCLKVNVIRQQVLIHSAVCTCNRSIASAEARGVEFGNGLKN